MGHGRVHNITLCATFKLNGNARRTWIGCKKKKTRERERKGRRCCKEGGKIEASSAKCTRPYSSRLHSFCWLGTTVQSNWIERESLEFSSHIRQATKFFFLFLLSSLLLLLLLFFCFVFNTWSRLFSGGERDNFPQTQALFVFVSLSLARLVYKVAWTKKKKKKVKSLALESRVGSLSRV